ncbi:translin-associated factor X-interacting protein 1 isoform X3 [Hypomesus transpacificus]|uniref:translin-associated factor X-interacting protein 1 isoform X3 n=1 Tax=Hypomesus transpacificus TaxID=137520 RepID=UPI001F08574F|nr:translin-associated factor X-interacting protein 1 isoform X3 [Hypomesus transpacificus]
MKWQASTMGSDTLRQSCKYQRDSGSSQGKTRLTAEERGAAKRTASITRVNWTSSYLSTWPAHIASQLVQSGRTHGAGGKIRNHGCGDEFGGQVAKPKFLQQLEGYLRRELQAIDPQAPQVQERKLQAYREVFDCFIEDFKTYKPLLSAIKNEYEVTLAYLRDQVRELQPLRARLVMVSEECERRIMGLREEERSEIRALKQERLRLQKVMENMKEKHCAMRAEVSSLQDELAAQYLMYREERDARKLLITNLSSTSCGGEEQEADEEQQSELESKDPVQVELCLRVCREDLTRAQVELNRLHAEYGDVVPRRDWESLEHTHHESLIKIETLQADYEQMRHEYDTLLELHRQMTSDRDGLQNELDRFRKSSTPRPLWNKCAEAVGGAERWAELSHNQSSQRRLEILLEQLVGNTSEPKEFFTGLGGGAEVPVYLRYEGNLKNLHLQKADVHRVIREAWKEKVTEDEKSDKSSDLGEFLHRHLERQHREQAGDWAYSLMESFHQHSNDDVINLFYLILTGKVDESVYHGQTHLLSNLLKVLIKTDTSGSGSLTLQEFREALRMAFPLKTDLDVEEMLSVAQQEQDSSSIGTINYQKLLMEDSDGKHRDFLTLVRRQSEREKQQYVSQLKSQLGGREELTVADLRSAFRSIDPSLDSTTLDWNLTMAFQCTPEQLEKQTAPVETEQLLQRLLVANVTRAGVQTPQD